MKYNLCSSCKFFQPLMLTEEKRIPKSCLHDEFFYVFGPESGGFPNGIDIIHCDFFTQQSPWCGDVLLQCSNGRLLSYVLTQPRNFKLIRCPQLYDNSQNIKILKNESRKSKIEVDECPF